MGGLELHTLDLARALAARGHAVTVVTSRHPTGLTEETPDGGVRIRYLAKGRPGDYSPGFFRSIGREVAALDAAERFDIVHAQEFAGLFMGAFPGRMVTTVHGTMFSETPLDRRYLGGLSAGERLKMFWRFKPRLALYPAFRRMLRRPEALVVDSTYTFRELLRIDPGLRPKIIRVPLGLDHDRYPGRCNRAGPGRETCAAAGEPRPLRVVLLGRVQRMKGIGVALRAVEILKQRGKEIHLVVGGGGRDRGELEREAVARGVADCVQFRGVVPAGEVADFFRGADLFLFPDLTQPAFGLVAVEAMLYGLPVVAARSGAIPEVVSPGVGWLYEPWDAVELAAVLARLADHPDEVRRKGEAAPRWGELFTAQRMAMQTEAVYERVAGGL